MSKRKNMTGISIGSSSVLVIFVVLCLTTFATLSLVSARADYKLTQRTAQATAEYYAADTKAEETFQKLSRALGSAGSWQEQIALMDAAITYEVIGGKILLFYQIPINDQKRLYVELAAELGTDGNPIGSLQRLCWQTQLLEGWEDDGQMNLAKMSNLPTF